MSILLYVYLFSASTGIIITDNVLFYEGDLRITALMTGDTVTVTAENTDTVFIECNEKAGTLLQGVLIDLADTIAEEQLFMFARGYHDEQAFPQAMRLFVHFLHFFPGSRYYPEALFYTGRTFDERARQATDKDTVPGITKNEGTSQYYYAGTAYKQLLEQYPSSCYAGSAAYYLILCLRAASEPWDRSLDKITKDMDRLQELVDVYGEFDERAAALEDIGYDYRVLYELTGGESYKESAQAVFASVIEEYPSTVHEASARVHLYELEHDIPIYLY
ncbi:hypothetical protein JXB22_03165 [candidate division WOR-3 bacterium]|nr:hypothetical protein [candidate division WOR-3 bacterium]